MDNYIEHHGIFGMKWGVRRFQNPDGSLTEAGKRRYFNKRNGRLTYDGYSFTQTERGQQAVKFYRDERKSYFDEASARSEVKSILQRDGFTMYDPEDVDEIAFMLDRANDSTRTEDLIYHILYHDPID